MDPVTLGMARADARKRYLPLQPQPVEIPAGLGWDQANYPLSMTITDLPGMARAFGVSSLTPESAFDAKSTARSAPGTTLWVDPLTGNDSTGTGTSGAPFKSGGKAQAAANAAGLPATIFTRATATMFRGNNPTNNAGVGGQYPTVDTAWIAVGGRVNTGTMDTGWTAALDATYTRTYKSAAAITANTINRVVDMQNLNRYGNYTELQLVGSIDACNNTPDSWYHHSDGFLYINRRDGVAVTTTNTRFYRSASTSFSLRTGVNLYIGGQTGNDGWDVEGGHAYGPLEITPTAIAGSEKVVAVSNSTFRYGGGKVDNTVGRGISIDNWRGLAIFSNCRTDASLTDGLNFHNSLGSPKMLVLTINCSSTDNGRPGQQSCNAHTLHEDVISIDLCSEFADSHGGSIRNIGTSKAFYAGTFLNGDLGDFGLGGGGVVRPTLVRTDDTAEVWVDRVRPVAPAGAYVFHAAAAGSKIHQRACWPHAQPVAAGGTIDTY